MYKIKIISGFRRDQEISIDASEAHKAYYLFYNPDERACFSDGTCLIGSDVRAIKPDYNGTMGWNPTYVLGDDDWNEIRDKGVDRKMRKVLSLGKEVAWVGNKELLKEKLSIASKKLGLYGQKEIKSAYAGELAEGMNISSEVKNDENEKM